MHQPLAYFAAGAAFAAPAMLLASDVLLLRFVSEPGLALQKVALIVFVPALAWVPALVQGRARWLAIGGAAVSAIGAIAIVVRPTMLNIPLVPPAVLFPLGLLVLAVVMNRAGAWRGEPYLLAAGALIFPPAHISGVAAALVLCDILLIAAFWMLAGHMAHAKSQIPNSKSQVPTPK